MTVSKYHILYIEDDVVDQMAFKRMIGSHKDQFSYTIASDIDGALAAIESNNFSAVITDYHLGMNTAFEIIPKIKDCPVILVTGGGDESLAVQAMKMGAYDYLIKDDNYNYLKFLPISVNNAIEHYQAKTKLLHTQQVYKLLVETANDVIYKMDAKGYCIYVNEVGERMTGFAKEELIGIHFSSLVNEKHSKRVISFYARQFKEGIANSYLEFPIVKRNGDEIWVGQNVSTLYDADRPKLILGFQGVVRDISEKKRRDQHIQAQQLLLEEQNQEIKNVQKLLEETNANLVSTNLNLEKLVKERTKSLQITNEELQSINKELDMFIYRASHDLKGPIARMQGLASLALTEAKTDTLVEYILKLKQSGREMSQMLAKLQAVNEIKRHQTQRQPVNINTFIDKILKGHQQEILAKEISVEVTTSPELQVVSDEYLLGLILDPIIENAIAFHSLRLVKSRHLKIDIEQEASSLTIVVRDNGMGINQECLPKVFDIFFRGSELSRGNGLGLYIAAKCAEKLGIQLEIYSQVDDFTVVKVIHQT